MKEEDFSVTNCTRKSPQGKVGNKSPQGKGGRKSPQGKGGNKSPQGKGGDKLPQHSGKKGDLIEKTHFQKPISSDKKIPVPDVDVDDDDNGTTYEKCTYCPALTLNASGMCWMCEYYFYYDDDDDDGSDCYQSDRPQEDPMDHTNYNLCPLCDYYAVPITGIVCKHCGYWVDEDGIEQGPFPECQTGEPFLSFNDKYCEECGKPFCGPDDDIDDDYEQDDGVIETFYCQCNRQD